MSHTHVTELSLCDELIHFKQKIQNKARLQSSQCIDELHALDRIISKLKLMADVDCSALIDLCLDLIYQTSLELPKLNVKLIQVFLAIERVDKRSVDISIQKHTKTDRSLTNCADLAVWGHFLDQSSTFRSFFSEKFPIFMEIVNENLDDILKEDCEHWTISKQEQLHVLTKLSLHIVQHLPEDVLLLAKEDDWESPSMFSRFLGNLFSVLQNDNIPKPSILLIGTAMCIIVNIIYKSPWQQVNAFFHLYFAQEEPVPRNSYNFPSALTESECRTPPPPKSITFGHLALLNGLLSCASPALLSTVTDGTEASEKQLVYEWLFFRVSDFTHILKYQYHTFKMFSTWFTKLGKPILPSVDMRRILASGSPVVERSLGVIWTHMDSPVEGVNECVIEAFKRLLSLTKCDDDVCLDSRDQSLADLLLPRVLGMSWQVKGKHNMLACLLQHLPVSKLLDENKDMLNSMLECLTTNYLASPATHLFRAILKQISSVDDSLSLWTIHCLPCLMTALTSCNSLVRHNIGHHWLPWSIKLMPAGLDVLLSNLQRNFRTRSHGSSKTLTLQALIVVLKVAKNSQQTKSVPCDILSAALVHNDIHVRQEAFSLICISLKKAESLSENEIQLLKANLSGCLNVDSPSFRQQMQNNIQSLVRRARDRSLSLLKSANKKSNKTGNIPQTLRHNAEFLDWLWRLCLNNLHGGANFQRAKTCVDWMWFILDGLVYQAGRQTRKGGCPEGTERLLDWCKQQGWCEFFTVTFTRTLLGALLNTADEVREVAAKILMQFFPSPLPLIEKTHEGDQIAEAKVLFTRAVELCNRCQARECQSGALLVQVLYKMYALNGVSLCKPSETDNEHYDAATDFLIYFIERIEHGIESAKKNILTAAKYSPGHGFILAYQKCLLLHSADQRPINDLSDRLVNVMTALVDLVLDVFGGSLQTGETAPSFEQMSESIQRVIKQGDTLHKEASPNPADCSDLDLGTAECDDVTDSAIISIQFKLIKTWCWLNIKELSILLADLVVHSTLCDKSVVEANTVTLAFTVGQIFIKILTRCRHKGAIEGCNVGFSVFCKHLLRSSSPELHDIPRHLLSKLLRQVTELSAASVTRRSAGLPLIVQSIVASESKTKQVPLLQETMVGMLGVLSEPRPIQHNQQQDLPQVHAMNILKAVFTEASVAHAVMPYLEEACRHTITGFSSPYWAIRNASMQLYGALVTRMLGQKKTRDDGLNTMTAPEFFALYPSLQRYLLEHVVSAADSTQSGVLHLHPGLVPVLSILAKLGAGVDTTESRSLMRQYREPMRRLAASPVHTVRRLAALSLVPLVPCADMAEYVVSVLNDLCALDDPCGSREANTNRIHGSLLQVRMLLISLKFRSCLHGHDLSLVRSALVRVSTKLFEDTKCCLIKASFVELVSMVTLETDDKCEKLIEFMTENVKRCFGIIKQNVSQVGEDQYVNTCVHWWLASAENSLASRFTKCVNHCDVEMQLAAVTWLQESATRHRMAGFTQECLSDLLNVMMDCVLLNKLKRHVEILVLETVASLLDIAGVTLQFPQKRDTISVIEELLSQAELQASSYIKVLLLRLASPLLGMVVDHETNEVRMLAKQWSDLILTLSDPGQADHVRSQAVKSIKCAGVGIWKNKWSSVLPSLVQALVMLLQDENDSIRCCAAETVAMVTQHETDSIQSEAALDLLLNRVVVSLSSSRAGLMVICDLVNPGQRSQEVLDDLKLESWQEVFASQEANAYKEQTVLSTAILTAVKETVTGNSFQDADKLSVVSWVEERLQRSGGVIMELRKQASGSLLGFWCCQPGFNVMHSFLSEVSLLVHILTCCGGGGSKMLSDVFIKDEDDCLPPVLSSLRRNVKCLCSTIHDTS